MADEGEESLVRLDVFVPRSFLLLSWLMTTFGMHGMECSCGYRAPKVFYM